MPLPWFFIHGAGSTSRSWSRQHRLPFSSRFCDLPARPQVLPSHLITSLAQWCLAQLTEGTVVVGHSMGGAIAQTMALLQPQAISALVLVGTGPRLPVNPDLLNRLVTDPDRALENIARWSLARQFDPHLYEMNLRLLHEVSADRILHELTACSLFDSRAQLPQYHGPVFLIRGQDDRMTPEALSNEFLTIWPDMPVHTIANSGHLVMLEQPQLFNETLLAIADHMASGKNI